MKRLLTLGVLIQLLFSFTVNAIETSEEKIDKAIGDNAEPAIVKIYTYNKNGIEKGTGTGFLVDENGGIITNYHVIRNSYSLKILYKKGKKIKPDDINVKVIAIDHIHDVAYLRADISDKPVHYLSMSNERVKKNDRFFIISNPVGEGIYHHSDTQKVGNIRYITNIIPERKKIAAKDINYKYEILIFHDEIKGGSSGAPLLEIPGGKVIGIATGSTADIIKNKLTAFAVPIKYAINLLNQKKGKLEKERDDDPYYARLQYYNGISNKKTVRVDGLVVNAINDRVEGAHIELKDKNNKLGNKFLSGFKTETDSDGRYELKIPFSKYSDWILEVSHPQFKTHELELNTIVESIDKNITLKYNKNLSNPTAFFYPKPSSVILKEKPSSILLESRQRENFSLVATSLKWELCNKIHPCNEIKAIPAWLKVSPEQGNTKGKDKTIKLKNKIEIELKGKHLISNRTGTLYFKAKVDQGKNKYALVYVYENNTEKKLFIDGIIYVIDGGAPVGDMINIGIYTKKDNNYINIKTDELDDDGYFHLEIPSLDKDNYKDLYLSIASSRFSIHDGEKNKSKNDNYKKTLTIDATNYIQLVPK